MKLGVTWKLPGEGGLDFPARLSRLARQREWPDGRDHHGQQGHRMTWGGMWVLLHLHRNLAVLRPLPPEVPRLWYCPRQRLDWQTKPFCF